MSVRRLKPLFARVLIEREKFKQAGSIIIPEDQQKRYSRYRGTVIAVGPTADPSIHNGANVLFGQHSGAWINAEGNPAGDNDEEEFFLCQDEDVLCVIEDKS